MIRTLSPKFASSIPNHFHSALLKASRCCEITTLKELAPLELELEVPLLILMLTQSVFKEIITRYTR